MNAVCQDDSGKLAIGNTISEEDRLRFEGLFAQLDKNKDGTIDLMEFATALGSARDSDKNAKAIVQKADRHDNSVVDFEEFVQYMQSHEKKLKLVFTGLDCNNDGKIDPNEVIAALSKLGVKLSIDEAASLISRLDKNKDHSIDWAEFRDYFGIHPGETLEELIDFWREPPMIDIGEQLTCPPGPTRKTSHNLSQHLIAGGIAGAVSRTATAPLDRLKIMLQVFGSKSYLTPAGVLRQMLKDGGVKSLWRGNGVSIAKIAPESAVKFAAFEQLKRLMLGDSAREISVPERFAAGSLAGATAQTVIFPLEVVKTRLAVATTGQYNGMIDCAVKTYRQSGKKISVFFRGYVPNILGIIPYAGIDLTIYETLKLMYLRRYPQKKDPSILLIVACGTISSTCGQVAAYPFALVRTRLQAQDAKVAPLVMTQAILRSDGFRGLYRGLVPNFLKVLPAVTISYVVYEQIKKLLKH